MGYDVLVIGPSQFKTFNLIGYPEIKISIDIWNVGKKIDKFKPDFIHIVTEGPIGIAARWYCKVEKRDIPHNTSYHTAWPEYFNELFKLPMPIGYFFMRLFHKFSSKVLVTTKSMKQRLEKNGFKKLEIWSRGVDTTIFNSAATIGEMNSARPILLCVSRASKEKGLDNFCSIKTSGTKILVGDGPYLKKLKQKYKDVKFVGYKSGVLLAHFYANADVFVFPSKTDTFGVVMLEANACGTPIAGYPVTGPIDIIENGINGYIDNDLNIAIQEALKCDRKIVAKYAEKFSWEQCTKIFVNNLQIINY
jgi:glycosyltransferase involved in cell wall biosynthesis